MSIAPRVSTTGAPPTLPNPAGMFMASGANPAALYNSLQTSLSHSHPQPPFIMFPPGGAPPSAHPPVSGLPSALSDRPQGTPSTSSPAVPAKASTKTAVKNVPVSSSSSSSSPSPASPSQQPRKKHSPSVSVQSQVPSAVTSSNSQHCSSNQDEDVSVDSGGNGPYNSYHDMKQVTLTAKQASDLAHLSQVLPSYHPSPMMVLPPFGPAGGPLFQMQQKVPLSTGVPGSNVMRSLADAVQDAVSDGPSGFSSNMATAHCEWVGACAFG